MIPIGNLDFGHLYDTPSYLAIPIPYKLYVVDNLLLKYVGLPHVLVIAVPLGWSRDHSKTFFPWSTPS